MFCGRLFVFVGLLLAIVLVVLPLFTLLITPSIFIVFQVNPRDMLLFVHIYLTAGSRLSILTIPLTSIKPGCSKARN